MQTSQICGRYFRANRPASYPGLSVFVEPGGQSVSWCVNIPPLWPLLSLTRGLWPGERWEGRYWGSGVWDCEAVIHAAADRHRPAPSLLQLWEQRRSFPLRYSTLHPPLVSEWVISASLSVERRRTPATRSPLSSLPRNLCLILSLFFFSCLVYCRGGSPVKNTVLVFNRHYRPSCLYSFGTLIQLQKKHIPRCQFCNFLHVSIL